MNDKVKALILDLKEYRENDLILQVISEDKGFFSLVAKGAAKSLKQHYYPLCLYEFVFDHRETATMFNLKNAKLLETYFDDDLLLLGFKNILLEACLKIKENYEKELFDNLCFCLKNIDKDNLYLLGSLFFSYLCKLEGIAPEVDKCVVCGRDKVVAISAGLGGFLCAKDLGKEHLLEVSALKKFRLINKASFKDYALIADQAFTFADFKREIEFYSLNTESQNRAYKLLKDLV